MSEHDLDSRQGDVPAADAPATPRLEAEAIPPPLPWGRIVVGLLLVAGGVVWLLDAADLIVVRAPVVLAGALVVVGLALIAAARRELHGGLLATGIVLTALLVVATFIPLRISGGVGDRSVAPTSVAQVADGFDLAMGQLVVDLRGVPFDAGETRVEARVGMGQLVLLVPDGVTIEVDARVAAGEIDAFGRTSGGIGIEMRERFADDGPTTLVLELQVGLGQIEVRR